MDLTHYNLDAFDYPQASWEYERELQNLLCKISDCLYKIIEDRIDIPCNNENYIRDILLDILKDTKTRNDICLIKGYRFEKEVEENSGRADLKIININDFEDHNAYYIIECKRLDGSGRLNKAYVEDGINRFVTSYGSTTGTSYYSSHYGVNGMIGFIVAEVNVADNIQKLKRYDENLDFEELESCNIYSSRHTAPEGDRIKLFHLMIDFSFCT